MYNRFRSILISIQCTLVQALGLCKAIWPLEGVEVWLHSFLTIALEGGEGSASRPGRYLPHEIPVTHCARGWVGSRAGVVECRKSRPNWDSIPRPSSHNQSLHQLSYIHSFIHLLSVDLCTR